MCAGLIEVLSQHFPGETEKNKKNLIHVAWCSGQDESRAPSPQIKRVVPRANLPIVTVRQEAGSGQEVVSCFTNAKKTLRSVKILTSRPLCVSVPLT